MSGPPSFDDLLMEDWHQPRRPQARHRAPGRPRTGLRARATATLTTLTVAHRTARGALKDALVGSDTPPGGLTLHAATQPADGGAS